MTASPSPPSDLVIRPARPADVPAIGRLGAALVRLHHELDSARFIPAGPGTESGYAGFLGSQLGKSTVVVLVAEESGAVVGYAYAGMEGFDYMALRGPAGALYDLVVDPTHRGRGIGRALLEAAVAALRTLGAPRVVLSTAEGNTTAQRLFTSAGFRPTMREMTRKLGPELAG